jgi:hypothetical protein
VNLKNSHELSNDKGRWFIGDPQGKDLTMKQLKKYFWAILLACIVLIPAAKTAISAEQNEFSVIVGEWTRYDGDYTLRVRGVKSDGSADVGYFNPGEIHIEKSSVSEHKGLLKLFVKLQDKGYPGSTYTLYYYAEKDSLAGFYYQAAMGQTFEVIFFRK